MKEDDETMTGAEFDYFLNRFMSRMSATLTTKARVYSTDDDRLRSFRLAAGAAGGTLASACLGHMSKHVAALTLIVERANRSCIDPAHVAEVCGDLANYAALMEACLMEMHAENEDARELDKALYGAGQERIELIAELDKFRRRNEQLQAELDAAHSTKRKTKAVQK